MPNGRTRRDYRRGRNRRPAANAPQTQQMRTLNDGIKTLTLLTMDRGLPSRPDVRPMPVSPRQTVFTFRRSVSRGTLYVNNIGGVGQAYAFQLDQVPAYTDFTSLFDQYRIVQVRVRFIPTGQQEIVPTETSYPEILSCIDYDDATVPGNADTLRQYSTCMICPVGTYFERVIRPRFATSAYSGVFGSFAIAPQTQWIDAASPSVQYYGLKTYVTPPTITTGNITLYNTECEYTIQCRNVI